MTEEQKYQKKYHRKWYRKNLVARRDQISARRKSLRQWFNDYKTTLKCAICIESEPCCLTFHHMIPSEKDLDVTAAITNGWSKERIMKEISKCRVLCRNCHAKVEAGIIDLCNSPLV